MIRKITGVYILTIACLLLLLSLMTVRADVLDNSNNAYDLGDYNVAASLFKQHYDSLPNCGTDTACKMSKASDILNIGRCRKYLRQYNELRLTLSTLITNYNVGFDISAEAQYLIASSY